jgi:hypothetical protein
LNAAQQMFPRRRRNLLQWPHFALGQCLLHFYAIEEVFLEEVFTHLILSSSTERLPKSSHRHPFFLHSFFRKKSAKSSATTLSYGFTEAL